MNQAFFGAIATAGFLLTAPPAFAQELGFQIVSAHSTGSGLSCDTNSVHMVNAGTNMSLVFDNMNVNLPAGGDNNKLSQSGVCTVALNLTIPKDTYLVQASSQIFGGVEKSVGGSGFIQSAMYMVRKATGNASLFPGLGAHGLMLYSEAVFPASDAISEPLIELSDSQDFTRAQQKAMCRWTKSNSDTVGMIIQLSVNGARKNKNQTTIINVDGADTNFNVGMPIDKCRNI